MFHHTIKKNHVYKLDALITSHDDFDHSGALSTLVEKFDVKKIAKLEKSFPINVGGIIISNYNNFGNFYSDENSKSLVLGFNILNLDFVITGDAPIEIEKEIMKNYANIPCDVLKVGHHGSNTSTSDEFVKYLSPKEAVISVGKNNKYRHPHDSVLKTLQNNNVLIKRTDVLGTITYSNYKFL